VALKFIKSNANFEREVNSRKRFGSSDGHENFVVSYLDSFNADTDALFRKELLRWKELVDYKNMIIMPLAQRSLKEQLISHNIIGNDWEIIKQFAGQIAGAIGFLHSKGIIHGDLKPNNIVLFENRLKLIDFDASVEIDIGFSGAKVSTGFAPPELLFREESSNTVVPRSYVCDDKGNIDHLGLKYQLVVARPSHDRWSFGVTLYNLCSKIAFLSTDVITDNCDEDELPRIYAFDNSYKQY
jgi:serine/threonine protein kinase